MSAREVITTERAFGKAVHSCPDCGHGIDPHGSDPGGPCGVGGCQCFMQPNGIVELLLAQQEANEPYHFSLVVTLTRKDLPKPLEVEVRVTPQNGDKLAALQALSKLGVGMDWIQPLAVALAESDTDDWDPDSSWDEDDD